MLELRLEDEWTYLLPQGVVATQADAAAACALAGGALATFASRNAFYQVLSSLGSLLAFSRVGPPPPPPLCWMEKTVQPVARCRAAD